MGCFCCDTIGNIFRIFILGGTALGLALQITASVDCDFLRVPDFPNSGDTLYVGLFAVGDSPDNCIPFTSVEDALNTTDSLVRGARSTFILSILCAGIAGALVLFEWLFCKICCAGVLEGLGYSGGWILGCATYMIYGHQGCVDSYNAGSGSCDLGQASSLNIVAVICYFACGVLLCFSPQPDPCCKQCSE